MAITYQADSRTLNYVYRTSSGGTVFSANLASSSAFDYFDDTAVVDDALYIGVNAADFSKVIFYIGTPMSAGVTGVWEYYQRDMTSSGGTAAGWYEIPLKQDATEGFTAAAGYHNFYFGIPFIWSSKTIEGNSALWVRYRITAVTYTTGAASFTGVGLDDATSSGDYTGEGNSAVYTIVIDGEGEPDTFKWKKDDGDWTEDVEITGSAQELSDGVEVTFAATTGHTADDEWTITVTSITEGGANSTAAVAVRDAHVNIDGYSDETPCTLDDIVTYLNTNAPWLGVIKNGNHYDLRSVSLDINSRLLVKNQILETGFYGTSSTYNGYYDLSYLQMGELVGTSFGRNGGVLIMNQSANTFSGNISTTTKFYGSVIKSPQGWGYPSWSAETIYCMFDNVNPSPHPSGKFINCLIYNPGTWLASSGWFGTFDDNKIVIANDIGSFKALALFYNAGFTASNLDFSHTSEADGYFIYFQNSSANSGTVWNFINPKRNLYEIDTFPKMFYRPQTYLTIAIDKAWFYDDSAGTYTDITTAANNNTTGDIPLYGDVGDCIYVGCQEPGGRYGTALRVISTLGGTNDYEYTIDEYSGAWREAEKIYDGTSNFTATGNLWYSKLTTAILVKLDVNGYTGYWIRIRITKKGTGTPAADRFYIGTGCAMGDWRVYEKYTLDVKVQDVDGTAIEDATVTLDYDGTEIFSTDTDSDGLITQQQVVYREYYFDPLSNNTNNNGIRISSDITKTHDLTISKAGYETYTCKVDMDKQQDLVIELKTAIDSMPVLGHGVALRVDPTNSTTDRDVLVLP